MHLAVFHSAEIVATSCSFIFLRGSPLASEFIAFARARRWERARSDPFEDSRKKCEFLGCGTCRVFRFLRCLGFLANTFSMHLAGSGIV